jgi:hypothetical protein
VAQETRARRDKWDCIKFKKLHHSKRNNQKEEKINNQIGENLCQIFGDSHLEYIKNSKN